MRPTILTERLVLRDIAEADAGTLFELDSDPEVMRYIGPRPSPDVAGYLERIRDVYLPWQVHAWHGIRIVQDRTSGEFFGWGFIRPATASKIAAELDWTRSDEVEIGYRYRRSAWGRGIATEAALPLVRLALDDPDTSAIVATALARNAGSLRVLEKLGLERVGELMLHEPREPAVKLARVK
jgi:RimJ/RimL family protein N-acetyltransferase